jgi:protein-L-isoaspartate(D-aspartate) O-methyltransferase
MIAGAPFVASGDRQTRMVAHRHLMATIVAEARLCGAQTGRPELSARVLAAVDAVPRHLFVPDALAMLAYDDEALPIGHGQTISQPFIVALMTELADVAPDDVVLEIGTGSGYQAAILSRLAREVHSIEVIADLAETADRRLRRHGFPVAVHVGDGRAGHVAAGPYDAILVTAATDAIPPALVDQLRVGGRLVVPLGPPGTSQELVRAVKRADGSLSRRNCLDVRFVPLVHGAPGAAPRP